MSPRVEYVIVDGCAIKILDLTAMGALAEVTAGYTHSNTTDRGSR